MRCVSDSTLWIDLYHAKLIDVAFALPFVWLAPDVVVHELRVPAGEDLVRRGLQRCSLDSENVRHVIELASTYRKPSTTDLFCLAAAQSIRATLVTGDAHLRAAAEKEGITVHGTFWVLDQMVEVHQILNPAKGAAAIHAMQRARSRLPRLEAENRIQRWRG